MSNIKTLSPDDWQLYRRVRLSALEDAPDAFGSTLERELTFVEEDWRKRLERSGCKTFVAFADDSLPVGVIVGAPYGEDAGIYSMWVDSRCRRTGIGSALVDAVIAWSKENGFSKLFLDVADSNDAAAGLYHSKGFERTGVTGSLPPPRDHIAEHQMCLILHREPTGPLRQSPDADARPDAAPLA